MRAMLLQRLLEQADSSRLASIIASGRRVTAGLVHSMHGKGIEGLVRLADSRGHCA